MLGSKIKNIIDRAYKKVFEGKGSDYPFSPLGYLSVGGLLEEPFWRRYGLVQALEDTMAEPEPVPEIHCISAEQVVYVAFLYRHNRLHHRCPGLYGHHHIPGEIDKSSLDGCGSSYVPKGLRRTSARLVPWG